MRMTFNVIFFMSLTINHNIRIVRKIQMPNHSVIRHFPICFNTFLHLQITFPAYFNRRYFMQNNGKTHFQTRSIKHFNKIFLIKPYGITRPPTEYGMIHIVIFINI